MFVAGLDDATKPMCISGGGAVPALPGRTVHLDTSSSGIPQCPLFSSSPASLHNTAPDTFIPTPAGPDGSEADGNALDQFMFSCWVRFDSFADDYPVSLL
jgi:hypothetical protein